MGWATEDFWKSHTASEFGAREALDYILYYDEDNDIAEEDMTEWTPVDPDHLIELHQRGVLAVGDIFSHKGWHHKIDWIQENGNYRMKMWDGPTGEEHYCNYQIFGNEWS